MRMTNLFMTSLLAASLASAARADSAGALTPALVHPSEHKSQATPVLLGNKTQAVALAPPRDSRAVAVAMVKLV